METGVAIAGLGFCATSPAGHFRHTIVPFRQEKPSVHLQAIAPATMAQYGVQVPRGSAEYCLYRMTTWSLIRLSF